MHLAVRYMGKDYDRCAAALNSCRGRKCLQHDDIQRLGERSMTKVN